MNMNYKHYLYTYWESFSRYFICSGFTEETVSSQKKKMNTHGVALHNFIMVTLICLSVRSLNWIVSRW
jgi:hypothetical protein